MARKTQDTPSSIRIRENQKRSRARRKDLLESLQKRVQDFELKGVRATHEMQQAARRVAQENERLRSLLALHGVLREEVDSYLRSFDESGAANCPQVTSMKTPVPCQSSTPDTAEANMATMARFGKLETSCETAARIIIEMGGDKDRDLVRASLGCSGRDDCNVKNTTVLQVMGDM
ncbi:hypothetical protein K469DRAFT_742759 [Zopfia rhizophila CBS 207.26]|uniref:BZIP domain-containing protein n=1 Tax=Zopfia rhizophila CBS 207.26 TaxID=1314779 RepID=A0A6A6DBD1_9PEZI|nr:hypothetical protein K469DRAFT_742759 [Zopfia rhizophila CBS 207.26]